MATMHSRPILTEQNGIILSPFEPSDVPRVVDVINADSRENLGFCRAVVDGAGSVRLARFVPTNCEKVVILDSNAQVIAYAYLADREKSVIYELGGAVHPDYWGQGVGSLLLAWAKRRATRSQPVCSGWNKNHSASEYL